MTVIEPSSEQRLRAALLWAGDDAAAAGMSAAEWYRLEGIRAAQPEIVVPKDRSVRSDHVLVHRVGNPAALMFRQHRGLRVVGVEAALIAIAAVLDDEAFEIACEDARRRRLTGVPGLRRYLDRFGRRRIPGVASTRRLLDELDPKHAARSTLEVKARRLLVARGLTGFRREFPLEWRGRTYRFDFAFEATRTILETNGRRWHDDPRDYERDNEKWSVPGHHGYRLVLATWSKVVDRPDELLEELRLAPGPPRAAA